MDTPNVSDAALRLAELLVNDNEVDTFENLMLNRWSRAIYAFEAAIRQDQDAKSRQDEREKVLEDCAKAANSWGSQVSSEVETQHFFYLRDTFRSLKTAPSKPEETRGK